LDYLVVLILIQTNKQKKSLNGLMVGKIKGNLASFYDLGEIISHTNK